MSLSDRATRLLRRVRIYPQQLEAGRLEARAARLKVGLSALTASRVQDQ